MHRIKCTNLTPEQIDARLAVVSGQGPASVSTFSNTFAGRTLKIVLNSGPALSYRFVGNNRQLTEGDAASVQVGYGALTLDRIALLASHPAHAARLH